MRTHELVLARIEADLAAGRWAIGERLPAERAFAEELGVSRPSVREAIRVLEAMGVVRTAVGSGPDSGASVIDHPAAGLGSAMRLHLAAGTLPVEDVVALRALLETWAVGQAAARSSEAAARSSEAAAGSAEGAEHSIPSASGGASIAAARGLLDEMDEPGLSEARFHELDAAFHVMLAALSGNVLVEAVMLGLRGAIQEYVRAGTARLPDWERTSCRLRAEHRAILAAVEAGDGAAASAAVGGHIETFYREAGLRSDA